jgi:chemotaxis protein methyltransferase CheR
MMMANPIKSHLARDQHDLEEAFFTKLIDFIQHKTGLCLCQNKIEDLKTILSQLITSSSCENADQFYTMLHLPSPRTDAILNQMITCLTIGETYFFRISPHFKILQEVLIPEIISRKRGERQIRIWSAGCSTGEEPYSLAILLAELLPDLTQWDILILATDINRESLEKAQQGIYGRWSFREVPMEVIKKNFLHRDESYLIKKKFKDMVTFKPLNLMDNTYPSLLTLTNEMDLILCRNVTIYFTPETTKKVVDKFYHSLGEGGYLLVGPAEYSAEVYRTFTTRIFPEVIVYQKKKLRDHSPLLKGTPHYLVPSIRVRQGDSKSTQGTSSPLTHSEPSPPENKVPRELGKQETEIFREAIQCLETEAYNHAIEKFMEVLKLNPHNARAYFFLARISAQQNNRADAIHCLTKSITCDPLLTEAYHLLALLKLEEGNSDEAINLFKKSTYIDPRFVLGYYYLGTIYKKQGKKEFCKKMFSNVRELLLNRNLNDKIVEGEDISVGQILATVETELTTLK